MCTKFDKKILISFRVIAYTRKFLQWRHDGPESKMYQTFVWGYNNLERSRISTQATRESTCGLVHICKRREIPAIVNEKIVRSVEISHFG